LLLLIRARVVLLGRSSTRIDQASVPDGTPYLMSPAFAYDIKLNAFFYSSEMLASRATTRLGYARDLRSFLTFLQHSRGLDDWRHATEEDHRAYLIWRREDPSDPRISDAIWDRDLSAVNRFFAWQVSRGDRHATPIRQRERRPRSSLSWSPGTYREPHSSSTRCLASRRRVAIAVLATRGDREVGLGPLDLYPGVGTARSRQLRPA
jgi:hypothetical protein